MSALARNRRLRLPPYGERVIEKIRRDGHTNTYICADEDAWNTHRNRVDRIVLPPGDDPDIYNWNFLRGQAPTVIAGRAEQERIKRLLALLLRARVSMVGCIFYEGDQLYYRSFRP